MATGSRKTKTEKKVTRYTYDDIKEPRTPDHPLPEAADANGKAPAADSPAPAKSGG